MELSLIRKEFTTESTIGDLLIDGKFYSFALEDMYRDKKIKGVTAIPYGTYEMRRIESRLISRGEYTAASMIKNIYWLS